MISRRKKLSKDIHVPISATVDDVVSSLQNIDWKMSTYVHDRSLYENAKGDNNIDDTYHHQYRHSHRHYNNDDSDNNNNNYQQHQHQEVPTMSTTSPIYYDDNGNEDSAEPHRNPDPKIAMLDILKKYDRQTIARALIQDLTSTLEAETSQHVDQYYHQQQQQQQRSDQHVHQDQQQQQHSSIHNDPSQGPITWSSLMEKVVGAPLDIQGYQFRPLSPSSSMGSTDPVREPKTTYIAERDSSGGGTAGGGGGGIGSDQEDTLSQGVGSLRINHGHDELERHEPDETYIQDDRSYSLPYFGESEHEEGSHVDEQDYGLDEYGAEDGINEPAHSTYFSAVEDVDDEEEDDEEEEEYDEYENDDEDGDEAEVMDGDDDFASGASDVSQDASTGDGDLDDVLSTSTNGQHTAEDSIVPELDALSYSSEPAMDQRNHEEDGSSDYDNIPDEQDAPGEITVEEVGYPQLAEQEEVERRNVYQTQNEQDVRGGITVVEDDYPQHDSHEEMEEEHRRNVSQSRDRIWWPNTREAMDSYSFGHGSYGMETRTLGTRGLAVMGNGASTSMDAPVDKVQLWQPVDEDIMEKEPFYLLHADRHLEVITERDPMVTIRFVFLASQLPRSAGFAKSLGILRQRHLIDTYMIPHETRPVHPDEDIVLGFAGTLDRVCLALGDFLSGLMLSPDRFFMWQLCVLIPRRIHYMFIGEYDDQLVYDEENDMAESSIMQLRKVQTRRYGPIGKQAPDESLLTLESCSLGNILDAIRFIGEQFIADESANGPADDGFYCGGRPSVIPAALMEHAECFGGAAAKLHRGTPVSYVTRPLLYHGRMQLRRFHLQLLLTVTQAGYIIGAKGERINLLSEKTGAIFEITRDKFKLVRICDLGGHDLSTLVRATVAVVESLYYSNQAEWEIGVYVPQRVVDVLKVEQSLVNDRVQVTIMSVQQAEQAPRGSKPTFRLEPSEVESVAVLRSLNDITGIERAVRTVLKIMYGD
ncbi:hypothetical protein BGZ94_005372 [Podila epigama]|nr:hypothetical protein BGZ94_005372 [Podila epigama]